MNDHRLCPRVREKAVETGLIGLPEDLRRHAESCAPCRRYIRSVEALRHALADEPIYTPSLRRAALMAVESRASVPSVPRWSFFLIPAALVLNLFLSIVLPAGLFHEFLPAGLGRTPIGAALSVLAAACLGTASVLICVFSMKMNAPKEEHHA